MEAEFHNHMRIPWHDYMRKSIGYPRISLTVPSIVIMVPGLYLYMKKIPSVISHKGDFYLLD